MAIDINIETQVSQTITDGVTDKAPSENAVFDALATKVDKETGKGLSEEDFTMAEKNKLAGIEAGAQVNVNADWNATSGDAEILNKPTIPDVALLVPYTGAVADVDLGTHKLTAKDLVVNHPSGSGDAATITKGGNGEALKVVKSSGSGNAASITGGVTLLEELKLTTKLADAEIASAANWNAKIGGAVSIGQVAFGTAAGVIGGDSGLFWDNVNKRLGVGTSAPTQALQVNGSGLFTTDVRVGADISFYNIGSRITAPFNGGIILYNSAKTDFGRLNFGGVSAAFPAIKRSGANIHIQRADDIGLTGLAALNLLLNTTTDAGFRLDVNGTARFGATTVQAQGALSSDIALRVRNSTATGDLLSVNGLGNLTAAGDSFVNGVRVGKGGGTALKSTALGAGALNGNLTGGSNVAIGDQAMLFATGSNCIGVGRDVLQSNKGSNNIGIGSFALASNGTASDNVAIGAQENLINLISGSSNIAIGTQAGRRIADNTNLTSADNTILMGRDARPNANNQTNQIVIGGFAIGAGSNTATLGNTSIVDTVLRGRINLTQYATGSRPTYVKGALIYDSTLGKLLVGGNSDWEVVTSI
jgi:hypothetical protein